METYRCPNCGAPLEMGDKQILKCEYCDSEIHVSKKDFEVVKKENKPKYDIMDFRIYDISRNELHRDYVVLLMEIPKCQFGADLQALKMFKVHYELDYNGDIKILSNPLDFNEEDLKKQIILFCIQNNIR